MKRTTIICIAIGLIFVACVSILVILLLSQPAPVNGSNTAPQSYDTQTIKVYLGQRIHRGDYNYYYFHGVLEFEHVRTLGASDYIVIGHWHHNYDRGGMTNMYIKAEIGMIFTLRDKVFELVDYASDWIELEAR